MKFVNSAILASILNLLLISDVLSGVGLGDRWDGFGEKQSDSEHKNPGVHVVETGRRGSPQVIVLNEDSYPKSRGKKSESDTPFQVVETGRRDAPVVVVDGDSKGRGVNKDGGSLLVMDNKVLGPQPVIVHKSGGSPVVLQTGKETGTRVVPLLAAAALFKNLPIAPPPANYLRASHI